MAFSLDIFKDDTRFQEALGGFKNMFTPAPAVAPAMTLDAESRMLFDYKTEALSMATEAAAERSKATGIESMPTMTDYFIAANKLGETKAQEMKERGVDWSPRVFADLSSLTDNTGKVTAEMHISGFQINKADIEPLADIKMFATMKAAELAQAEGRKAGLPDMLQALQDIQQAGEKPPSAESMQESIESLKDAMDLDGDHCINDFFSNIDLHANFNNTIFDNGTNFHPAGTLMRNNEENGVALTEGAKFNNVVFDGMGAEDVLTLNKGEYTNITLCNINRGTVQIADNTVVNGINVEGMHANFEIGSNSLVSGMIVDDQTRILNFDMEKGATIAHSDLREALIAPSSNLQGTNWEDVKTNGSFRDVDMSGSSFKSVTFDGADLKGASFDGASLKNVDFKNIASADLDLSGVKSFEGVTVNGASITDASQMAQFGITPDTSAIASAEPTQKDALSTIRDTMQAALASIGSKVPEEPVIGTAKALSTELASSNPDDSIASSFRAQEVMNVNQANNGDNVMAAIRAAMLAHDVAGGAAVTSNDIIQTTQVASLERTVDPSQVPSLASNNMDRSDSSQG